MSYKSAGLAVLGLSTLAISQPLLNTLGHGATFFVAHGADAPQIITFALLVYLLPTALIVLLAAGLHCVNASAARFFISIAIGVLAGIWLMSSIAPLPTYIAIALAVAMGTVVAWSYFRRPRLRDFLQLFGLFSPLVLVFFLAFTPVKSMLLPNNDLSLDPLSGRQTPIIMMLFDELSLAALVTPDGDIDAGRLPNFARLAAMSTWYADTTTVSTQTEKAVPAILSGMRPDKDTQPIYSEFPRNLFTLLAASHTVSAMEMFTRLCPKRVCSAQAGATRTVFSAPQMYSDVAVIWLHAILPVALVQQYLPPISHSWRDFRRDSNAGSQSAAQDSILMRVMDAGRNERRRFKRFLNGIRNHPGAHLNYLHLALPHVPWLYLPDGSTYNGQFAPGQSRLQYGWTQDQYLVDQGALRYALQVEYVDLLLGKVLDELEQSGRLEQVMLIVVSDHGVAFTPGEQRRVPVVETLPEVARIPLFIKYPGQQAGQINNRKIETIDILPTIAEVLGLPLSGQLEGKSVLSDRWQPAQRQLLEAGDRIPDFERALNMTLASEKLYRVIAPGVSALEAIGFGAGKALVGTAAPVSPASDARFVLHLDNSRWYAQVDLDSGFLPARLTGTLTDAGKGFDVVVALNGTMAGSGKTYDAAGQLSIMLDPRQFNSGRNVLRAFSIVDGEIQEIAIVFDDAGWNVEQSAGGVVAVTDAAGTRYELDAALQGRASLPLAQQQVGTINGYACDETRAVAPSAMLLIAEDEVITTRFRMSGRPLIAPATNIPDNLRCWFSVEIETSLRKKSASLSIVAVFEDGRMLRIRP